MRGSGVRKTGWVGQDRTGQDRIGNGRDRTGKHETRRAGSYDRRPKHIYITERTSDSNEREDGEDDGEGATIYACMDVDGTTRGLATITTTTTTIITNNNKNETYKGERKEGREGGKAVEIQGLFGVE